ncbi:flavin reductase family protein [Qingshengfaniella alkalisoli]|uniref:Flavin reductase family protein n=1 Tax=Qingshengfaniella alkalisoli TaxID=2599296 RepID=A0A5B8IUZ1_9RHOB|nr:flavin reductase family protein [Qingshengfaniella alkalisoli]QDY69253.1 flavin reductase family protein [Qingshengfaniella alkalisoli]
MKSFVPGPDTQKAFREALGQFATGVTVVTTNSPDGPIGITANSFASVSLNPPLVLWSPAKASARYDVFAMAERFAIHIMASDQLDIVRGFARNPDFFDGLSWNPDEAGVPLIDDCLARFDCAKESQMDGGDHLVILGRVLQASHRTGAPLLFARGQFGQFNLLDG